MLSNRRVIKGVSLYWLVFFVVLMAFPLSAFAQASSIAKLDEIATTVQEILTGNISKIITTIALIGLGFGLIMNRDNQEAKKKFITWLIAVGVLRGAQDIVVAFWK